MRLPSFTWAGAAAALALLAAPLGMGAPLTPEQEKMLQAYWPTEHSPKVVEISTVAPDIIALTIQAQQVVPGEPGRYLPKPGDELREEKWPDGAWRRALLVRQGQELGWVQGRTEKWFTPLEGLAGDPLLYFLAEEPGTYTISSTDDAAWSTPAKPVAVYRKSLPSDWQTRMDQFPMRHRLYLKLAAPLKPEAHYRIQFTRLNVQPGEISLTYAPRTYRSEAVHVNQVGYRPDDPGKRAFVSLWMGSGGNLAYAPEKLRYTLIDEATGQDVAQGSAAPAQDVDQGLGPTFPRELGKAQAYPLELPAHVPAGRYRLYVEGIGCSYPFEVGAEVWQKAWRTQMRGLFHQRSGVELGAPYTTFRKPRDFHPADGAVVTRSGHDAFTSGENFEAIPAADTKEPAPDAWGGYHDAGDWNPRRASHLAVTMAQLELMELHAAFFATQRLGIPPTEGVPDLLTEARFEIDCFRRLQLPSGGVPYGIETNGDPGPGEVSWLSTQQAYVLAPNPRDTFHYAAAAARLAKVLQPYQPEEAAGYLASARKAFTWAEAEYQASKPKLAEHPELWNLTDNRNLAALILFDLTGEPRFHELFLENTCLKDPWTGLYWWGKFHQSDAACYYARLPEGRGEASLKKTAVGALDRTAQAALAYQNSNVWNLTSSDKYRPLFGGFFSVSGATDLVRAHFLTQKPEYLQGAIRSCQFQFGCNPNNLVYTTGLGANPIQHPLHLDSRFSGQPAPEGLTVFGNVDYWNQKGEFLTWPLPFISKPDGTFPNPYKWPLSEAYFDICLFVSMNEFTVDIWAPNILVWGYLAAQPAK